MKMTKLQEKEVAEKVSDFYAKKIGVEVGFFITPAERKKLSVFAMHLLNLRGEKNSVEYVRALYFRTVKSFNMMVNLCATLICRDILQLEINL